MNRNQARNDINEWLKTAACIKHPAGYVDQDGHGAFTDREGNPFQLAVPDAFSSLHLYGTLLQLQPAVDGRVLASALAINAQKNVLRGSVIALNTENQELFVHHTAILESLDRIGLWQTLDNFVALTQELRSALQSQPVPAATIESTQLHHPRRVF
ncbi:CesT family type III secretion system chaperone [Pseudomonas syringae]|uniref:CesT family type III secretion system chaperone n=1 Tax=Pseudomonas syringae TaxID=317 RepID=UPI0018E5E32C|nr:CesT family type III secretion system chaperone [Pseudomonas syringae]MBI6742550.1 CesT family type III secretion system chaperone [Pseudomonas syringae]MBI6747436.1 CesT family type III secretion system chaperone [Pseudomonas syringae]MBI6761671.1 CesT family type III secretion system chaperone [Pseudomonas syringae]MBI6794664.1 CesT family type III secretion system chaperone [Pseudomonas syringae]MBI6805351.1 CesT family type III secretion system chaperone [Pseudomonas syringae]